MKRLSYRIALLAVCLLGCKTIDAQTQDWVSLITEDVKLDAERAFCIYVADLNNDKYPDLITLHGEATENSLRAYLNVADAGSTRKGARMFVDITEQSGINARPDGEDSRITLPVALADINNDGNIDMVRGTYYHRLVGFTDLGDRCEVLLGDGKGHFTLVENNGLHELGLVNAIGFSFLDYDKDGNIDLFIPTWFKDYDNEVWSPGYLLKGKGDGTFTDVTAQAGITTNEPMYGSTVVDWNNDGWPDIATAPYCRTNGQLLKNNGDGTFTNLAAQAGYNARYMQGDAGRNLCMWAGVPEDYDNDGDMDLFFTLVHGGNDPNEGRSAIFVNGGAANNYHLTPDRSLMIKKNPQSSHNGDYDASWFDLDNDGWMDLVMLQGTYAPTTDRLYVFHQDADNVLTDITGELGLLGSGLRDLHLVEVMDYDLDGDDDIIFCRTGHPRTLQLIENRIGQDNNWTSVSLVAPAGVNKSCIGSRVYVWSGGVKRMREVYAGRGNASGQQPFELIFGLGGVGAIDSITVLWPNTASTSTTVVNPPINTRLEITSSGLLVKKVQNEQRSTQLKLYPNPSRDHVFVQFTDNTPPRALDVFDLLGRVVHAERYDDDQVTRYVSVANLPNSQYLIRVVGTDGFVQVRHFVVEN